MKSSSMTWQRDDMDRRDVGRVLDLAMDAIAGQVTVTQSEVGMWISKTPPPPRWKVSIQAATFELVKAIEEALPPGPSSATVI